MKVDVRAWPLLREQSKDLLTNLRLVHVIGPEVCAIVVTKDDQVFTIGDDSWLNPGRESEEQNKPIMMASFCGKKIKSFVAPCEYFLTAITEDGQLLTHGFNNKERRRCPTPSLVQGQLAGKKVVQVAFGVLHLLAMTDQGQVFSWGTTPYWPELPQRVTGGIGDRKAVTIACTWMSNFALLEDGQLYSWSRGSRGEPATPEQVQVLAGLTVKQISCGLFQCLALTDCSRVFAWDVNDIGELYSGRELCTDDTTDQNRPPPAAGQFGKAVRIAASPKKSAVQFADGTVWAWDEKMIKEGERRIVLVDCANIDEAFAPEETYRTLDLSYETVAETLRMQLDDKTANVSFQVGNHQIWAHKQALTQSCLYFDAMFQSHWTEHNKQDFTIDFFEYELFKAFLKYLYTEEPVSITDWKGLLEVAMYYCHSELTAYCKWKIGESISVADETSAHKERKHEINEGMDSECLSSPLQTKFRSNEKVNSY